MSKRMIQKQPEPSESEEEEEEDEEEEVDPTEKIQGLPLEQRHRVYGLMALVKETRELQRKKRERIAEIEREFLAKMQPLFEQRRQIISGEHEPSAEEVARGEKPAESKIEEIPSDEEEDTKRKKEEQPKKKGVQVVAPSDVDEASELQAAASRGWWHPGLLAHRHEEQ